MPSFMASEPITPKELSGPTGQRDVIEERLQTYQRTEHERDKWTRDLIRENQSLKKKVKTSENLELQVENLTKSLETKAEGVEAQKRRLQDAEENAAANPFAVVLLDGDGYVFPDGLLSQGAEGGEAAAQRLLDEVHKHLERFKGAKEWKIIIRIFVNLDGLARKCHYLDIVEQPNTLREFAAGFAQSQPLFDVVDVGYGKERADHKIRENFNLFVKDLHCRHIFVGCCHDNGYVPLLDSWKNNSKAASRISLIQHYKPGIGYKKLPFETMKFDSFRSAELQTKTSNPTMSRPANPAPFSIPTRPNERTRRLSTPGGDMSTDTGHAIQANGNETLKRSRMLEIDPSGNPSHHAQGNPWSTAPTGSQFYPVPPRSETPMSVVVPIEDSDMDSPCRVYLNSSGQRVDLPLPRPSADAFDRLEDRKRRQARPPCNNYHIKAYCPVFNCQFSHDPITRDEVIVLALNARQSPCRAGFSCKDPKCTYGHHCPFEPNCHFAARGTCKFAHSHGIDKRITHAYLDGDESSKRQKVSY